MAELGTESTGFLEPDEPAPLPPLPEYTCGNCGETFGTNFAIEEIECPECEARRCPHCAKWFGGDWDGGEGEPAEAPGDGMVLVSREDLRYLMTWVGFYTPQAADQRDLNAVLKRCGELLAGDPQ